MEIVAKNGTGFKVKGKNMTITSDPVGKSLLIAGPDRPDFNIPGPGEYEIGGVDVFAGNDVYRVIIDDVSVCFLATKSNLDKIGNIDILIVGALLDSETITKLEPLVVIPIGSEEEKAKFIKELGRDGITAQPKLSISKEKLPEEMAVYLLSC